MHAAVSGLKGLIKIDEVTIDNAIFKLHYKLTVLILAAFSFVLSTKQFFGDPISCMTSHKDEFPGNVLNNFCWIHSTYVLPSAWHKEVGKQVIAPGISKYVPGDEKSYVSYYQWVCFFLFFVAVLFNIPRFIWKSMESKKIEHIILGLNSPILADNKKMETNINRLATYLERSLGQNTMYALGFVLCELLTFANVVGQIYFTNTFLDGEFTTYGTEVIQFTQMEQENRTDPMIQVFPRVTKCTFHKFGPSGSIQNNDALCVLPINIVNEKIFIFLWFWYIILSAITGMALLYRLVLLVFNGFRSFVLYTKCHYVRKDSLYNVLARGNYGDWFVLNLLQKNISTMHYCELIDEMDRLLTKKDLLSYDTAF